MSILVTCTCGKRFQAREEHAGRRAQCPVCKGILTVPSVPISSVGAVSGGFGTAEPYGAEPSPRALSASPERSLRDLQEQEGSPTAIHPYVGILPTVACPLIYTDYGTSYQKLTRLEARRQELRYFNERWVTPQEYSTLRWQRLAISWIRGMFALSLLSVVCVFFFGIVTIAGMGTLGGAGVVGGLFAIWWVIALVTNVAYGALWYFAMQWHQSCRWVLVILQGVGLMFQIVYAVIQASQSLVPGLVLVVTAVPIIVNGLIIWLLVSPETGRLYNYNETH